MHFNVSPQAFVVSEHLATVLTGEAVSCVIHHVIFKLVCSHEHGITMGTLEAGDVSCRLSVHHGTVTARGPTAYSGYSGLMSDEILLVPEAVGTAAAGERSLSMSPYVLITARFIKKPLEAHGTRTAVHDHAGGWTPVGGLVLGGDGASVRLRRLCVTLAWGQGLGAVR